MAGGLNRHFVARSSVRVQYTVRHRYSSILTSVGVFYLVTFFNRFTGLADLQY